MYIGNTQMMELFVGDNPIKAIWLGTTKIWTYTYDYEISNVQLVYSDGGTYLKCNGSNYAYVQCTLTKKKGTYIEGSWIRTMNINWTYSSVGSYFKVTEDGKIYFDVDKMGTTDMSHHSNPFTTSFSTNLNGLSGGTLYLSAEPNVETYSTSIGYDIHASSVDGINNTINSFYTYVYCKEVYRTYFKSGKQGEKTADKNWYLYDAAITTGPFITSGTTGQRATINCGTNTNTYPVVRHYRIGYIGVTQEDVDTDQDPPSSVSPYDYYLDVAHFSPNSYTTDQTQALFYGSTKLTEDYTIQSSEDIILVNDAEKIHKGKIIYEFSKSDATLTITQKNGLIYITGVDSATDAWIQVTTYLPVEKEEWWMDDPVPEKTTLTFNIFGA